MVRAQTDVVKVAMDNPDAALMSAPLSDDGTFEIYGVVGQIRLLELVISGGGRPECLLHEEAVVAGLAHAPLAAEAVGQVVARVAAGAD